MLYFWADLGTSYRHKARFSRADRGAGFNFFFRRASFRCLSRRRRCCSLFGSVGFRCNGRCLTFSVKIRLEVSGECARDNNCVAILLSFDDIFSVLPCPVLFVVRNKFVAKYLQVEKKPRATKIHMLKHKK